MKMTQAFAILALALVLSASSVYGQGTPSAPPAMQSSAVAAPTYAAIELETTVNKPAAEVWRRIGKYCDIAEWFRVTCAMTSGKEGDLGSVRTLNGMTIEILVAKTEFSYTYSQPVRAGVPYNQYHGTLEARVLTPTTTRLRYLLVFDNSMLA